MLSWSAALPTSCPPAPSRSSWAAQGPRLQRMAPPAALAGQGCSRQPSEPHQQVTAMPLWQGNQGSSIMLDI